MAARTTSTSDTSVLGQALLGLLARRPATGYVLAQQMRHPIAFFWQARHSQIYPELGRLEAAGLLTHREIPGRGPHPTKEYRLTAAGRRAHEHWVLGDVDQPVRDVETVHVWSLWMVTDAEQVRAWVSTRRAHRQQQLQTYESERAQIIADGNTGVGEPNWSNLAAVELGIAGARGSVAWCDWMLTEHLPG